MTTNMIPTLPVLGVDDIERHAFTALMEQFRENKRNTIDAVAEAPLLVSFKRDPRPTDLDIKLLSEGLGPGAEYTVAEWFKRSRVRAGVDVGVKQWCANFKASSILFREPVSIRGAEALLFYMYDVSGFQCPSEEQIEAISRLTRRTTDSLRTYFQERRAKDPRLAKLTEAEWDARFAPLPSRAEKDTQLQDELWKAVWHAQLDSADDHLKLAVKYGVRAEELGIQIEETRRYDAYIVSNQ
ncbi:uncharacterized protein BXZ73DRAFT_79512 [Epithele typhae]|uniref:uncharacterized protein n=1 Tax=Epithele typhae TaxID=378194 RepID=UPI0020087623|nr:uncharacterized protein BXZ73DRAFT_79512 [Epithele typhae]KAH9923450.1 hypothetical protein BXZ73DRAFT_79512 [Epithele typhae]